MKIKLFTTLIILLTFTSFAQGQTSEHLDFKDVPINGTLDQYIAKMEKNGFKLVRTKDEIAILNGDFAGYKNCNIKVSTLKGKNLVYKIAVLFPERNSWSKLSKNYFSLKNLLTIKYGKPTDVVEKFIPYQPSDNRVKLAKVKFDNCKYHSIWKTPKGEIQLLIDRDKVFSCFVKLAYYDKINDGIIREKVINDL